MATAQEQLMGMLNPQTARLLDNQMRQKQVAQRSEGAGMLSGLTQAYTGMADAVTGAAGLTPMGANQQKAIQANAGQQEILNAMQGGEGETHSARLLNAAKTLLASASPQARMKGAQLQAEGQKALAQEQSLQIRKDTLTLQQETADIRKIEAEGAAAKRKAQLAIEQKKTQIAGTEQKLVQDSEGNKFTMITSETGDATKYTPAGDVLVPVGKISTMQEVQTKLVTDRNINAQFQDVYLKDRSATVKKFGEVKKVFNNASKSFELLEELEKTGGAVGGVVANFTREAKRYLGIQDSKSVPIELLKKKLGMSIAGNLKETFGGSQITDSERTFLVANMLSIDDTPEVMKRKLKAIMEVTSKGLSKLKDLSATKNYTGYTDLQNKYIQEDYADVMDKFELQFDSSTSTVDASGKTADQILAEEQIAIRAAQKPDTRAPRMRG
mgnify:CR=1 FL=1